MAASMEAPRFGRVLTAMVTPFDEGGRLDLDGAATLARHLAASGSDGLVIAGTTGESPTLTDDERLELFGAVAGAVTIPVVAGTGTNDTAHSVELTKAANSLAVAGILAVTPYYNRPSQAGLAAHFGAIADATPLPVMLYDIPVRSGRKIAHDTLLQVAHDHANVLAVKDAAGDVAGTARTVAETPGGFQVYCGDDVLTLPMIAVGAVGLVGVATHWAGNEFGEMIAAYFDGEVATARQINVALSPSNRFETGDDTPNPLPAKAMLRVLGLPAGECRLPMGKAPAGLEDRAKQVLADLEEWRSGRATPAETV
ncbi:MAG TPA: 4-hydroxy-tetrahydrodipicolinate synthase [Acidimicrobiales bacterium]|nr:4-hydroxy-tetrahydrodipicolinate synthase [Acidimicrobiales bacterium]